MLGTVSPVKMHGSMRCIKAIHDKLRQIEAVDLKFTSPFSKVTGANPPPDRKLRFSQSFNTSGSSFPANLG
jgi:hypothetical protein